MTSMPPPTKPAWQAQYFRLIAFTTEPIKPREQNWFESISGSAAAELNRTVVQQTEKASFRDGTLALDILPDRVIWTYGPAAQTPDSASAGVPSVGLFLEHSGEFKDMMTPWLQDSAPEIKRLAFASELIHPTPTLADAYSILAQQLRSVDIDNNTREFLYRVNRTRQSISGIEGLTINRLTTWKCVTFKTAILTISGDAAVTPQVVDPERFACELDLDINSSQDFEGVIPRDRTVPLFSELIDLGKEFATEGEVP